MTKTAGKDRLPGRFVLRRILRALLPAYLASERRQARKVANEKLRYSNPSPLYLPVASSYRNTRTRPFSTALPSI